MKHRPLLTWLPSAQKPDARTEEFQNLSKPASGFDPAPCHVTSRSVKSRLLDPDGVRLAKIGQGKTFEHREIAMVLRSIRSRRGIRKHDLPQRKRRFLLEGLEVRRLLSLTELALMLPHGTGSLTVNPFVGSNAGLSAPTDPVFYNGSFYVPNATGNTISQVPFTQPNNVSTFVPLSAGLNTPDGLAFDGSGNLYIANFHSQWMTEKTAQGTIIPQFAQINNANAPIAGPNGHLYVCDKYDNMIMQVNLTTGMAQTYVNNTFGLSDPIDLAIDKAGDLYVCSQGNNTIYKVTPGGNNASPIATGNLLDSPTSMVLGPDGNLYVYNSGNSQVIKVSLSGQQSVYAQLDGGAAGPYAGLVFGPDGYLYVANWGNNTMSQVAPGSLVEGQGITNQTVLHFTDGNPSDTASDYTATIQLGDGNTLKFNNSGVISGPAGAGGQIVADPTGGFDVQLTYPYPEFLNNATFSVTVNANDGASLGPLTTNFSVLDAPLQGSTAATAGGAANVANSSALSNATFTDADPGDHHGDFTTVTINWGDTGPTSNGQVVYQGTSAGTSTYTVTGSHTYAAARSYPISINVMDAGGNTATITGTATVAAATSPYKLVFTAQPSSSKAGAFIAPVVQVSIEDSHNHVVTSNNSKVTVAIGANPGNGALGGTLTVAAVKGVANFRNLWINKSGTGYTLGATDSTLGAGMATSRSFNVIPAAARKLVFTTQPSSTRTGTAISPVVQVSVEDAYGNVVTSNSSRVTVALGANPGKGKLSGSRTVAAIRGVATFRNLSINKAGIGYTLTAKDGSLPKATSRAFSIMSGSGMHDMVSLVPGLVNDLALSSLVEASGEGTKRLHRVGMMDSSE
jgi:sugar lactone lactonase YvrE